MNEARGNGEKGERHSREIKGKEGNMHRVDGKERGGIHSHFTRYRAKGEIWVTPGSSPYYRTVSDLSLSLSVLVVPPDFYSLLHVVTTRNKFSLRR